MYAALRFTITLSFIVALTTTSLAQQGLLDSIRNRVRAVRGDDDAISERRARMKRLLNVVTDGAREVIQVLPENTQQAIRDRRSAWMQAAAAGFGDLSGQDIEEWLADSDNVIASALSRAPGAPEIDARQGADKLPSQWWFDDPDQRQSLAQMLTEQPTAIIRGAELSGEPVLFVNGIATKRADAVATADLIAKRFGRPVHLLHNPTFMEPPHESGLMEPGFGTDDMSECLYDRLWPAMVINRLNKHDPQTLKQAEEAGKILQGNPTTRQLAYLLLASNKQVTLITHSQGCIIGRNAFFTLAMLGKRQEVEERIVWVASGIPLNDKELSPIPRRTTILDVGNDPVANIVGMRGAKREYKAADHSFNDRYLQMITIDQL